MGPLADFKRTVAFALIIVSFGCIGGIYLSVEAAKDAGDAADQAKHAISSFKKESFQRRDDSCEISEREHLTDVKALRQTYKYIDSLKPDEVKDTLNQFIIANMPQTEQNARIDVAPEYCDEPHIGLPEPDPVLPKKRDFSHLLVQK